jgi:phosphoesterase RecJ-like protein
MNQNLPEFVKNLAEHTSKSSRIIQFFHKSPDLDSIGSNLGFLNFIQKYNPDGEFIILSKDEPSANIFIQLKNILGKKLQILDPSEFDYRVGDLLIFIDFPEFSRTNNNKSYQLPEYVQIAVIDHHVSNLESKGLNYIDTSNLSASSIVYEILKFSNIEIKKENFEFIIIGMLGDSGFFRHKDHKFVQSLQIIQDYCKTFGNEEYFKIIDNLESNKPLEEYNLQKIYLNNLVYKNEFAYTSMTSDERGESGVSHTFSETTNGASLIRNIEKTKFVFSVTQDLENPTLFNISFRSCAGWNFPVRDMAIKLGGGGHLMAAGAQIESENINSAISLVLSCIHELNGF